MVHLDPLTIPTPWGVRVPTGSQSSPFLFLIFPVFRVPNTGNGSRGGDPLDGSRVGKVNDRSGPSVEWTGEGGRGERLSVEQRVSQLRVPVVVQVPEGVPREAGETVPVPVPTGAPRPPAQSDTQADVRASVDAGLPRSPVHRGRGTERRDGHRGLVPETVEREVM